MKPRSVFGYIFLAVGLGIFGVLVLNTVAIELNMVNEAPALGLVKPLTKLFPTVGDLPHIFAKQGTNEDPFQQFNVVKWLGWAFVIAAFAEVGSAYLKHRKTQVQE